MTTADIPRRTSWKQDLAAYLWWQRQHSLHHAHTGNLDKRGPGEIYTMTLAEYEGASLPRRVALAARAG